MSYTQVQQDREVQHVNLTHAKHVFQDSFSMYLAYKRYVSSETCLIAEATSRNSMMRQRPVLPQVCAMLSCSTTYWKSGGKLSKLSYQDRTVKKLP